MKIVELAELALHSAAAALPSAAAIVAAGNFDGVHKGHQAVLGETVRRAQDQGRASAVLTFEPHPREILQPHAPPFRLTDAATKALLIEECGIDILYRVKFDADFSRLEAADFVIRVLLGATDARHVITGGDFAYGAGRAGNSATLAAQLKALGVGYSAVAPLVDISGEIYSSSRVRAHLQDGEVEQAAHLLGRYWQITGLVIHGDKRGRQLGFPTANFRLGGYQRPRYGVYGVWIRLEGEKGWRQGVANIGKRPTVGSAEELAEVHIFDFQGDIYGQACDVRLAHFLRGEEKFDGIAALTLQIGKDVQAAEAVLKLSDPDARF